MTGNRRTPAASSRKSAERQGGHSGAQSPRVRPDGGYDTVHSPRRKTETATSAPVGNENSRFGGFGGFLHRLSRLVASRLPPRSTTRRRLMVVPCVQPRGVRV